MHCISLSQPYASLWAHGVKLNETRSRCTTYRGNLLIHASSTINPQFREYCDWEPFKSTLQHIGYHCFQDLPRGVIIGQVEIIGCAKVEEFFTGEKALVLPASPIMEMPPARELSFGNYAVGRSIYLAKNHQVFKRFVPAKGTITPLIWEVPEEIYQQVLLSNPKSQTA